MKQALQKLTLPLLRRRAEEESAGLPALMANAEKAAHSILTGEHAQRKSGNGEKFWQFREYDPTDRPQDIDWRQSAKSDRIFVRQKEQQTMQTVLFWCAAGSGMDYSSTPSRPTKQQDAVTVALALAILMKNANEQIGLLDGTMYPGRSDMALQIMGQRFLDADSSGDLPVAANIPPHADIILCGDFLSPPEQIEAALRPLAARANNGIIIQTLDPAELSLPFAGRAIFEESTGAERHHIFHIESIRNAYQDKLKDHLSAVKDIGRKCGWHWILHTTDNSVRDTLSAAWTITSHEQFKVHS